MMRFEQKLFKAALEEALLQEVPQKEIDRLSTGDRIWPAEPPGECSRLLLGWLDKGLVTVIMTESSRALEHTDARSVLEHYEAWGT